MQETIATKPEGELEVSFGYQWPHGKDTYCDIPCGYKIRHGSHVQRNSNSFSCLSGAALSANATLANTNICNGFIGEEILPILDSPKAFRRVSSSPTFSRDILSSSLQSSISNLSCSSPLQIDSPDNDSFLVSSISPPSRSEELFSARELQMAGGAAGEDRVQAVCSEENGWLFCAVYDGFNGRDAADFLAGTFYKKIISYLDLLDWEPEQDFSNTFRVDSSLQYGVEQGNFVHGRSFSSILDTNRDLYTKVCPFNKVESVSDSFMQQVLDSLQHALIQAESDFLDMVEQEMSERPDLVSVGSCVLVVLLHGNHLYTMNLGDSRAVLASISEGDIDNGSVKLKATQLTEGHNVDNEIERNQVLLDHPNDPSTILSGKVKGKLKVTRAFGVGYLKKKVLNDALIGILRVRSLISPPYVSVQPSLNVHKISKSDQFVIVASDGLFDFFNNDEAVKLVHSYISSNPSGDPAKFLVEQLVIRAADYAGFSTEELMNIPAGRRRKYHDDVTVIVIILGANKRTLKASVCM